MRPHEADEAQGHFKKPVRVIHTLLHGGVCCPPHSHSHSDMSPCVIAQREGGAGGAGREAAYSGLQLHPQIGLRGRAVPPGRDSVFLHQNQAVTLWNLLLLLQAKEHSETRAEPDDSVK